MRPFVPDFRINKDKGFLGWEGQGFEKGQRWDSMYYKYLFPPKFHMKILLQNKMVSQGWGLYEVMKIVP